MPRSPRKTMITTALAALASLVVACSAAPATEPSVLATSQSVSCESDGIHVDTVCSSPGPSNPPTAKCSESAGCTSQPYTASTYETPRVPSARPTDGPCVPDDGFTDQLAAMGCTPTREYILDADAGGPLMWYMSWCPHAPSDTQADWTVVDGCNQCTGEPPQSGWVLVGWTDAWCGGQPGGGCTSKNCFLL